MVQPDVKSPAETNDSMCAWGGGVLLSSKRSTVVLRVNALNDSPDQPTYSFLGSSEIAFQSVGPRLACRGQQQLAALLANALAET